VNEVLTKPLVLPNDVVLMEVGALPAGHRRGFDAEPEEWVVTRPAARTPSRVISKDLASLLGEFRKPATLIQGIMAYASKHQCTPASVLEGAFPLLRKIINSGLLVTADSPAAKRIAPTYFPGDYVDGFEICSVVQTLEDSDVYQIRCQDGTLGSLKTAKQPGQRVLEEALAREADVLRSLNGLPAPAFIACGVHADRHYLVTQWEHGISASTAAATIRRRNGTGPQLLNMACEIAAAYAALHDAGVLHGDVHPGNLIVTHGGGIRIVDFGLARFLPPLCNSTSPPRGAVAYYVEPEYAAARLRNHPPPPVTEKGEQYSVAAMIYFLMVGEHYVDFSKEKLQAYEQILHHKPIPFANRGAPPWPAVETVIFRALCKESDGRQESMRDFERALAACIDTGPKVKTPRLKGGRDSSRWLRNVLAQVEANGAFARVGLRSASRSSVHSGGAGIAYALYRIACVRDNPQYLSMADVWCTRAIQDMARHDAFYSSDLDLNRHTVGEISLYHSPLGVHCVQALISRALGDFVSAEEAVSSYIAASRGKSLGLDLFSGSAGILLGGCLMMDAFKTDIRVPSLVQLESLCRETHFLIWNTLNTLPEIGVQTKESHLGIAHGWAGFLYTSLRWHLVSGTTPEPTVSSRLEELRLLSEKYARGVRWPVATQSSGPKSYMPGWCNGNAGYVHLWLAAHRALHDPAFLVAAEKAASHFHSRNDPQRELPILCCGNAGISYALMALYKSTGAKRWLRQAEKLATCAVAQIQKPQFPFASLYRGEIGIALLAADLATPELSAMPLFEHEGWPRTLHGAT